MRWLNDYYPRQLDSFLYRVVVWFPDDSEADQGMISDWFYFKAFDGCHALEHLEDVYRLYLPQDVVVDILSLECFDAEEDRWISFGFDLDDRIFYGDHFAVVPYLTWR